MVCIYCVYAIMAPAHESETIVFNFRKLLSTLPNYSELEQILLFSVNWGKQVWTLWTFVTWHFEFSSHDVMNFRHMTWIVITWHYECSSHDMNVHHMTLWMFITWHHKCSSHDIVNVRHMALGMFTYFFFIIFLYASSFSYTCLLMTW